MSVAPAPVRSLETRESRRRRWTTILIVLVWAEGVLPLLIRSLTTAKYQVSLTMASATPTSGLGARADKLLTYGEMLCCLVILVIFGREGRFGRNGGLVLSLLPWAYMIFRDDYGGNSPDKRQLAYPLIILAIWALRPSLRDLRVLGYLVGATAVIALAMGFFDPASGILHSAADAAVAQEDKQIFSQGILLGPFNQGNQLGAYLVVGVAALGLIQNRRWRWLMIALTGYALLWTAARSSLATFGVLMLAVVLLNSVGRRARVVVGVCLAVVVAVVACITPVVTRAPEAFTNRGFIWTQVFKAWDTNSIFGLGSNWFAKTAASSGAIANSAYDAHNQFLQLLTTGGVLLAVMVVLLLVQVTIAAASRARAGDLFGLYFVIALLGAGWLEASFGFVDRNQMTAVAIVPMAFLLFGERPTPAQEDATPESAAPIPAIDTQVSPVSAAVAL